MLNDSTFRNKAKRLQAEYARHDGPTEAAILLEKLATTKQPVLNAQPTNPAHYPARKPPMHARIGRRILRTRCSGMV